LKERKAQYARDMDQYPRSLKTATDMLSTHRWDPRYHDNQKKKRDSKNSDKEDKEKDEKQTETSFTQTKKQVICFCFRKKGHTIPDCPQKDTIAKDNWWINKQLSHTQAQDEEESEVEEDNDKSVQSTCSTRAEMDEGPGMVSSIIKQVKTKTYSVNSALMMHDQESSSPSSWMLSCWTQDQPLEGPS
jgi:hypothetical protein